MFDHLINLLEKIAKYIIPFNLLVLLALVLTPCLQSIGKRTAAKTAGGTLASIQFKHEPGSSKNECSFTFTGDTGYYRLVQWVELKPAINWEKYMQLSAGDKVQVEYVQVGSVRKVLSLTNSHKRKTSIVNSCFNEVYTSVHIVLVILLMLNVLVFLVLAFGLRSYLLVNSKKTNYSRFQRVLTGVIGLPLIVFIMFYPAIFGFFQESLSSSEVYRYWVYYHLIFYLIVITIVLFVCRMYEKKYHLI